MALKVVKMLKMLRFKSMPRMHLILKMLGIRNIGIAPLFKACAGGASHIRVGAPSAYERTPVAWRVVLSGAPYRAATCMTASLGAVRGKEKQLSSGSANPKHEIGKERTLWRAKH